jgi:hypothetical protein
MEKTERIIPAKEFVYLDGPKPRINELTFAWDIFTQFIKGFRTLHFLDPCITVFGSARYQPDHPYYTAAAEFGKRISQAPPEHPLLIDADFSNWRPVFI